MSTKRSHYLPRTYLKHFLNDDSVFMYKKGEKFFKDNNVSAGDKILIINGEAGLKNIGLQNNLYDPCVEGIGSDDLEEIFRGYGEDFYNEIIIDIGKISTDFKIPQIVKDKLCLMMASMRVRTPQFKREIEEMDEKMRKHLTTRQFEIMTPEDIVQKTAEITDKKISLKTAKDIKESIVNQKYDLKYPNGFFIKYALSSLEMYADIFHQMTLNIYKTDGRFFITTDNPLVYFVPKEHLNFYVSPKALVSQYCELFFPLTKNLGAHLTWRKGEEKLIRANRKIIDAFNYNLSHNSLDYIFAPIKTNELNKFVQEYIPYPFKFNVH